MSPSAELTEAQAPSRFIQPKTNEQAPLHIKRLYDVFLLISTVAMRIRRDTDRRLSR
jgi:hypothetical protein